MKFSNNNWVNHHLTMNLEREVVHYENGTQEIRRIFKNRTLQRIKQEFDKNSMIDRMWQFGFVEVDIVDLRVADGI